LGLDKFLGGFLCSSLRSFLCIERILSIISGGVGSFLGLFCELLLIGLELSRSLLISLSLDLGFECLLGFGLCGVSAGGGTGKSQLSRDSGFGGSSESGLSCNLLSFGGS